MRIKDLLESPADIHLMLKLMGYDLQLLQTNSKKVKEKVEASPNHATILSMKSFLVQVNSKLYEIAELSQWHTWANTKDGKDTMEEIDQLYNDNIKFMKRFP